MKKIFRLVVLLLLIAFVVIQFFQPQKNLGEVTTNHLFQQEKISGELQTVMQNACLDCHSNQTNYLWYHKIAPVSWVINNHIEEGKEELNFSEWGELDLHDKITILDEISEEVEHKKMPIKSYQFMHKKAKLSDDQITMVSDWAEGLAEQLLEEVIN